MIERDVIVAVVSILVGLVMIWNGWLRSSEFRSPMLANIQNRFGKRGTRYILGGIGIALIVSGVYLLLFMPSQNSRSLNIRRIPSELPTVRC